MQRPLRAWLVLAAPLIATALVASTGCGGSSTNADVRSPGVAAEPSSRQESDARAVAGGVESRDPAVAAAELEARSAEHAAETERALDGVQLRLNQLGVGEFQRGGGAEIAARVDLEPLRSVDQRRAVRRAEADEARTGAETARLEERVRTCDRRARAGLGEATAAIASRVEEQIDAVRAWSAERLAAGIDDELDAAAVTLESAEILLTSAPDVEYDGGASGALPPHEPVRGPLDDEHTTIAAIIERSNPEVEERRAASRRFAALAEAEAAERRFGLDFVELTAEPLSEEVTDVLSAQIAFGLPAGRRVRRAAASQMHTLEAAESLRAEATIDEMVWVASVALERLALFETRAAQWRELLATADAAEEAALRWLHGQEGEPTRILGVLRDAHAARLASVEAREEAARAACTLLSATGVAWERWPRRDELGGDTD